EPSQTAPGGVKHMGNIGATKPPAPAPAPTLDRCWNSGTPMPTEDTGNQPHACCNTSMLFRRFSPQAEACAHPAPRGGSGFAGHWRRISPPQLRFPEIASQQFGFPESFSQSQTLL